MSFFLDFQRTKKLNHRCMKTSNSYRMFVPDLERTILTLQIDRVSETFQPVGQDFSDWKFVA